MSNDPVLLLHGQPGAAAEWERVRASIGDGRLTLAFDRPGWDRRSAVRDLAGNASAARAVLDQAGADRATVVGHSLGAAIAAWLAWSSPERVGGLVLIAPAANVDSLSAGDYLMAAPVIGWLASIGAMAGGGLLLGAGPVRRWVADATLPIHVAVIRARAAAAAAGPAGARAPAGSDLGADHGAHRNCGQRCPDRSGAASRRPDSRG